MYRLIAFEGISGSGKTTLYESVRKHVGQMNLLVHRFTPTKWVYDQLYERNEVDLSRVRWIEAGLKQLLNPLVVWCICDPHTAGMRKVALGDQNVEPDLARAQMLYWKYFQRHTLLDWMSVRTDELTVEDATTQILRRFNRE